MKRFLTFQKLLIFVFFHLKQQHEVTHKRNVTKLHFPVWAKFNPPPTELLILPCLFPGRAMVKV